VAQAKTQHPHSDGPFARAARRWRVISLEVRENVFSHDMLYLQINNAAKNPLFFAILQHPAEAS
jgi:hypothetical protein